MRFPGTKRKPEGASEAVRKSAVAARAHRDTILKVGLVALALTAGSSAISSLRQRMETSS